MPEHTGASRRRIETHRQARGTLYGLLLEAFQESVRHSGGADVTVPEAQICTVLLDGSGVAAGAESGTIWLGLKPVAQEGLERSTGSTVGGAGGIGGYCGRGETW